MDSMMLAWVLINMIFYFKKKSCCYDLYSRDVVMAVWGAPGKRGFSIYC
jgi:hypothetical protein